ncbi:hypothetical protein [Dellaglioa algida]|uniref:hypothetical protein n=1 Tax=Dellaglioa algida TaxID=105612 RepID=UPI0024C4CCA9|nr:hypothetical protein [Dellaglioa algida]MDK1727236.1 hypothetical protein [Dellaglioa algida]
MGKFENNKLEYKKEILTIINDYVQYEHCETYIYCANENRRCYLNLMFRADGEFISMDDIDLQHCGTKNKLEDQLVFLKKLKSVLHKLRDDYLASDEPLPSELKIDYNRCEDTLVVNKCYDVLSQDRDILIPEKRCQRWFNQVENKEVANF